MPAIIKDKLITIFCIFMFGFTGVLMAQEKITDESLTGLTSEGKAYLEKKDLSNADKKILEAYENAKKVKSSLSPAVSKDLSAALFKVGDAVLKKEGSGKIKDWAVKSIEINDRNDDAYLLLAQAYYDGKDYDKAINAINTANNIKKRANNYLMLAYTRLKKKSYEKAIDDCSEGLKNNPTAKEASALLNMRGFIYNVAGDKEKAKKDYLDAFNKDPENKAAKSNYDILKKLES
jgi:tetratricopeptide (TPR) repeat protein